MDEVNIIGLFEFQRKPIMRERAQIVQIYKLLIFDFPMHLYQLLCNWQSAKIYLICVRSIVLFVDFNFVTIFRSHEKSEIKLICLKGIAGDILKMMDDVHLKFVYITTSRHCN